MELTSMEKITNEYYEDNAKKLRNVVDGILHKFGGLSGKDHQDFYSLANEVFVDVLRRYDGKQSFKGFLYSCLMNKFKSEMTFRNRKKRLADRNSISLDTPVNGKNNLTIGDVIESDFDMDRELDLDGVSLSDGKVRKYMESLSSLQRKIIKMRADGVPVGEIKYRLKLTNKQYEQNFSVIKSFEKTSVLIGGNSLIGNGPVENFSDKGDGKMAVTVQTMEKSIIDKISVISIITQIMKKLLLFDHPLQRESNQWSPSQKGNLISDVLQKNPIPQLIFAEQVVNGVAYIWNLDGKQRCTVLYSFYHDEFKITRNIRRWNIPYQAPVMDEDGNVKMDKDGLPVFENKVCDIRGKKYSDLPEELQNTFKDYNFEMVKYINCSSDDIAYHIIRHNEGKQMSASQKGITRLGEEFASIVKSISNMPFFKDLGGYKVSEFKNGVINRVVVESVMVSKFLNDWKKKQDDMCLYIKENASASDFDDFEDMVVRLENVITDDVSDMFNSRDSFIWFGLFSRFMELGIEDSFFIDFMDAFNKELRYEKIDGISYEDINDNRSTKDKGVVIRKINHLEKLMHDYLGINDKGKEDGANDVIEDVLDFIKENADPYADSESVELYESMLDDVLAEVDDNSPLLSEDNRPSLIAIVAYSCYKETDDFLVEWFIDYFGRENGYIKNQYENYRYMRGDYEKFVSENKKKKIA